MQNLNKFGVWGDMTSIICSKFECTVDLHSNEEETMCERPLKKETNITPADPKVKNKTTISS